MPQLLHQYHLACAGLCLNRNAVWGHRYVSSQVQKGKSSASFTPAPKTPPSCQAEAFTGHHLPNQNTCFFVYFHHYCPFHEIKVSLHTGVSHSPTNIIPFDFSVLEGKISPTPSVLSFLLVSEASCNRTGNLAHISLVTLEQMLKYRAHQLSSW